MNNTSKILERHPLSGLFSRLDLKGKDLDDLAEDIQTQGLLSPITLHDGMVLDGWNRYQACLLAAVEPVTKDLHPGADPWEFVKGSNMLRRHMSPAERVAVMLLKVQMEGGVPNGTPSVRDIQKDLDVGQGTAQRAQQIAQAHDPAITEALADKRVSLDRAAEISKLPKEERQAAIDAPKPKPDPKESDDEIAALKATIADQAEQIAELTSLMKDTMEENDSLRRTMDAEDLLAQFDKEVKRYQELARVVQVRNGSLITEVNELKGFCKHWKGKFERLEKSIKGGPAEEVA